VLISLHKNAATRPVIRQRLSGSDEPASVLALRCRVSEGTVRKCKRRNSVQDLSATPHTLQMTQTPAQEGVVVELRRILLLPLDDLLAVCREFLNPEVSRPGLDRCLRRHGVSNLKALLPKTPAEPRKTFKTYEPGFLHVDVKYLPQMADETTRRYWFVAIDRATRWVFVRLLPAKTAANARRFLSYLHRSCPIRITKILTDNGKEFTDRLLASRARAASGSHEFDQLCAELGIEHRLTPPKSPQTNGMVERFNGRIADVLKTNRFDCALDLEQTIMRYVALYNTQLPQSVLGSRTPIQAMKEWHKSHPHLFVKPPRNLPGRDI
jgi:transposase InsO family protein